MLFASVSRCYFYIYIYIFVWLVCLFVWLVGWFCLVGWFLVYVRVDYAVLYHSYDNMLIMFF